MLFNEMPVFVHIVNSHFNTVNIAIMIVVGYKQDREAANIEVECVTIMSRSYSSSMTVPL